MVMACDQCGRPACWFGIAYKLIAAAKWPEGGFYDGTDYGAETPQPTYTEVNLVRCESHMPQPNIPKYFREVMGGY